MYWPKERRWFVWKIMIRPSNVVRRFWRKLKVTLNIQMPLI
ncbi:MULTISPECIES: hypothetical protein [Photorhabdus]